MASGHDSWRDGFRALGESLFEVVRAELEVVGESLKRSGRWLGISLGLFAAAGFLILACLPALLILAAVAGLREGRGWPLWAAALAVAGVVLIIGLVLALIARVVLARRFENPVATVRYRFADHVAWWDERILSDDRTQGGADEAREALVRGDGTAGEPPAGA